MSFRDAIINSALNWADPEVQKKWGSSGIQPGDIAAIAAHSHHFIVTDVNQSDWNGQTLLLLDTVEGNTQGQFIKVNSRI